MKVQADLEDHDGGAQGSSSVYSTDTATSSSFVTSKVHSADFCSIYPCRISVRSVFTLLAFLGMISCYLSRACLSLAIVAMVNSTADTNGQANLTNQSQAHRQKNQTTQQGDLSLDANVQGLVLASFYYGYIITQIPGGWIAERWGGKYSYGGAILLDGVCSLLTPVVTSVSIYALIVLRVVQGLTQGVMLPALVVCISKWLPPLERTTFGNFIYSGGEFGVVLAFPVSGALITSGIAGGWPSVFYIFGASTCALSVIWFILVYESPAQHPRISQKERNYIEEATLCTNVDNKQHPFPLVSVMKSIPFWAIATSHVCSSWAYYTLLTTLPIYMSDVLRFDLSQNGVFSTFPYLGILLFQTISGYIADTMRKRGISTTFVRKCFNTAGIGSVGTFLIAIGFVGSNKIAAVLMLAAVGCGHGISYSGFHINHLDIAPRFAGTLYGMTNMLANIGGMVGPIVARALTQKNSSSREWQKVFLLMAAIDIAGAIVYLIFASGEEQTWAKSSSQPAEKKCWHRQTPEMERDTQLRTEML